ncbi:MAG: glycosyltransferase [Planctomycetaceae bacterium]|jgi:UDP-N-acetylglucosamine--N-acetylmuramyl-(pentapeptide) pyrophosphoryl-undecaprenol N-acetylglucosamine transferase
MSGDHHSRHIVFSGGGSGGHLTPSIAIAKALLTLDTDAQVTFLTSGRDVDRIVLEHSFVATDQRCTVIPLSLTQPPRLDRSGPAQIRALWKSIGLCRRVFAQQPVGALLSTGAFASVPGLLAAKRSKIPVILFEANAQPGKVNRWWKRCAALSLSGWPPDCAKDDVGFEYVGMPVRPDVTSTTTTNPAAAESDHGQILVLGGSQGSRRLNSMVRAAISQTRLPSDWHVLHQTGDCETDEPAFGNQNRVTTVAYLDSLGSELHRSAFVISRAGAVTLGELAATGCPSILVPLHSAAENHQHQNAARFVRQGAALLVEETGADAVQELLGAIHRLVSDAKTRAAMRQAAQSLHQPGAAQHVAELLLQLADQTQRND